MMRGERALRAPGFAWAAAALLYAAAAAAVALLPPDWAAVLDWQPALAWTQPWRWWSAAFVHLSPAHLAANLAGCGVVAAFGAAARLPPRAALAWCVAWPLTQLALLVLAPALTRYAGLSGVLHAGVAVAAWFLVTQGAGGRRRTVGWLVWAGLAAKLLSETPWRAPVQAVPGWDIPIAAIAHLSGALAGLGCAAVVSLGRRRGALPERP